MLVRQTFGRFVRALPSLLPIDTVVHRVTKPVYNGAPVFERANFMVIR